MSSLSDQEVLVQHYFMLDGEEQSSAAPFSWLIKMHLENLWEESEFMPGLLSRVVGRVELYTEPFKQDLNDSFLLAL